MGRALKYAGEYRKFVNWATFLIFLGVMCGVAPYYLVNILLVEFITGVEVSYERLLILCAFVLGSLVLRSIL